VLRGWHSLYPVLPAALSLISWWAHAQLLRIGRRVSIACLPFEVLAEFALRAKAANPSAMIVTISGGYEGYMPLEVGDSPTACVCR
jgi:hypothetical protein